VSPTKLIPAKPVIASVAAGNALATVTITKPTDPTSQSITGYQYSINKGASYQPVSVANGKFTITGLANGVATSVQIRATNFNGNSLASVAKTVTPATTPSAPTIGAITPSAGALSIAFTAASTGGSAITGYQYSLDGGSNWITPKTVVKTSPLKLTGLANATTYHVQLRSVNARGTGSASATVDATTPALIPGAPVIASITKTRTSLTVDVTAPLNTGGGAILNYAYSTDGKTWVPVSPASSSTHIVINDLKTNTLYAIRIAAINSAGQGAFASSAARTLQ
jgi:titin